ncbi:hypothetical protein IJT17_01635 [bacterium]|nr:hypothetical protein [bacterium]
MAVHHSKAGEEARCLEFRSDEALAKQANSGSEAAWIALVRRYKPFVLVKAAPLRGAARDEALFAGFECLFWAVRSYDSSGALSFGEWAARRLSEALPKQSDLTAELEQGADDSSESDSVPESVGSGWGQPLDGIPDPVREKLPEVLSELEREVFVLYSEGRSYQEIAETLQRPVKSIDNALCRIKRKLEIIVSS